MFLKIIESDPNNYEALRRLGFLYKSMTCYETSLEYFKRSLGKGDDKSALE